MYVWNAESVNKKIGAITMLLMEMLLIISVNLDEKLWHGTRAKKLSECKVISSSWAKWNRFP